MAFEYAPEGTVEVPEIPWQESVTLPASSTALIVVDMQNDFVKPGGSLIVEAAADTVGNIRNLRDRVRNAGGHVLYTQDTHIPNDPEFEIWPEHCVQGSEGWRIIDELSPGEGELVCPKNRYDAFYGSWLDHFLSRIYRVEHLIVTGTVANICVAHTGASAGLRWFDLLGAADCMSALTPFDQALALRQFSSLYAGRVVRSEDRIRIE